MKYSSTVQYVTKTIAVFKLPNKPKTVTSNNKNELVN